MRPGFFLFHQISGIRLNQRVWALLVLAALTAQSGPAGAGEIWVGVDTGKRTLSVMDGGEVKRTFENISVGRNGVTLEKVVNDQKTPLGTYHVRRINEASRFHLFFGLDYPTPEQAVKAYESHRIDANQLEAIYRAHRSGEEPSFDTPLGGAIGIHGLGAGDPGIHEDFNWTDGCVALTDEQVDELAMWIQAGTRVVIY
jgi:murein L,D-transpeptidase YafK